MIWRSESETVEDRLVTDNTQRWWHDHDHWLCSRSMPKHCHGQVLNDGSLTSPCEAFAALHGGNSDDEAATDTN